MSLGQLNEFLEKYGAITFGELLKLERGGLNNGF